MSTLAVLVGSDGVAMAADSILVRFDPSGVITAGAGHLKIVGDERRIAGWVGLGAADQLSMTDAISEALFTATTIEQVAATLVDRNGPALAEAARMWAAHFGSLEGFLALVVAERTPSGVQALEYTFAERDGILTAWADRLTPFGSHAWCSVYGVLNDDAARWTSHYALRHEIESLTSRTPMAYPLSVSADLPAHELESVARQVAEGVVKSPPAPALATWPAGVPTVAGPVVSVRL